MSKFNSETSFLYQLFKENSNFIVQSYARLFVSLFFMIFIIIYIYLYMYLYIYTPTYPHFKAFPVSKFNSETSFLYQLFKENSNVIVLKPCKLINEVIFYFHYYLYLFIWFETRQVLIGRSWPSKIKNSFFFFQFFFKAFKSTF